MAVTQTGEQVVLYQDGTWTYVNKDSLTTDIHTNPKSFNKDNKASFLLKSKRVPVGCWIDTKKWQFESPAEGDVVEYELDHNNGVLYAMMLTEKLDIPLTSLGNIAIENARDAAPDLQVLEKEYRTVNGTKILMLRMIGTIQDIRFTYLGYYYTGQGSAVQFLVYGTDDSLKENLTEVETLLNGFVVVNE